MQMLDWIQVISILVVGLIMAGALVVFLWRMIKREPFWPSFKKMMRLLIDGISGVG